MWFVNNVKLMIVNIALITGMIVNIYLVYQQDKLMKEHEKIVEEFKKLLER